MSEPQKDSAKQPSAPKCKGPRFIGIDAQAGEEYEPPDNARPSPAVFVQGKGGSD